MKMKEFDHTLIDAEDLTFTYDHFGYMIQYKGVLVGGV